MTQRIIIAALLVGFMASEADAQNRTYRRRGAILGGLGGAAIGVAIGDKGGNGTAGALVGGAVGAIAGGAIGNQKDQRIEHNQRSHSGYRHTDHYYYYGQPVYSHAQPGYPVYRQPVYPQPVTPADVIQMQHRGLTEATIIRLIQTYGVAVKPTVSQVIDMHEFGVSERVIAAMQGDIVQETGAYVPSPVPTTEYWGPNTQYQVP